MIKNKLNLKKTGIVGVAIVMMIAIVANFILWQENFASELDYEKLNRRPMVYLSDLEYDQANSKVGWRQIYKDKNFNGKKISFLVDGQRKHFRKGLFAHAKSEIVYDLTKLKFDKLRGYLGVDYEAGNATDGVIFSIVKIGANGAPEILLSSDVVNKKNGQFFDLDISGAKKIILKADINKTNNSDWAVYGDVALAKLNYDGKYVKELNTLEEYDVGLKAINNEYTVLESKEFDLLKRDLVRKVGYDNLQGMATESEEKEKAIRWLLADVANLRNYMMTGEPEGGWEKSIEVLGRLLLAHGSDLNNVEDLDRAAVPSARGKKGDLYTRMMMALSATHSKNICYWNDNSQCSDPLGRYEFFKKMHAEGKLNNKIFETIESDEMRWLMQNYIDDTQLRWLNNYARVKGAQLGREYELNPYSYIRYTFDYKYDLDKYYQEENRVQWDRKYGLSDWNISYGLENGKKKI